MRTLLFFFLLAAAPAFPATAQERVTVFAAASLKEAMDHAVAGFRGAVGGEAVVSLAASSVLARQIEAGAPADIFISADEEWVDWIAERGLVREGSQTDIASNELVIVGSAAQGRGSEPGSILSQGRFAMGDPAHVPAGRYAEAALTSLGLWENVRERAVFGENVRIALEFARRGEVAAAIVYGSDQMAVPDLVRLYTFPQESHPPVRYVAAVTRDAVPAANAFLEFLSGEAGQEIFRELGFAPPIR